ncbi:polyphosphate kinase 2 [Plastorhodobacter daqingensis]|uniref:ADP/GDP-polyphosphate phosphotransferase n=1 Tax=Plastorhodobacter daqingensis TaxID=1387281 RepID=A0ABW2UGS5_9RHOB
MSLPFDGAISRFLAEDAPHHVRAALDGAGTKEIVTPGYPYDRWMAKADYECELSALQLELVKLQHWVRRSGTRLVILFEGRDTAGKGGAISRFTLNLNPRVARIEALDKPSEDEARQWFFQRYIERLPQAGRMALFDRSWYNRGVLEPVFGFCTEAERARFFVQLPAVEQMLIDEGMHLVKLWLEIGQAEQLRRMLARERDPLKQWKLSAIDVEGLHKWHAYSAAITDTLARSDFGFAPWTVILADDKHRARLAVIRKVLSSVAYHGRDDALVGVPDPAICGGPELRLGNGRG